MKMPKRAVLAIQFEFYPPSNQVTQYILPVS